MKAPTRSDAPAIRTTIEGRDDGGRVARLVVDNPARLNCLGRSMIEDLAAAVERLADDDGLRVAVLTGAGDRAFIGGADITELAALEPDTAETFITALHRACAALRDLPVPVIARISGYCLGGGLEVAVACDMRIAADHSVFGMPEVRVGIPSVIEAALLPRLIGWGRTGEFLYSGTNIDAARALDWGLVERVVPMAELDNEIDRLVDAICTAGPRAVRQQKALMRDWERLPLEQGIEAGIAALADAFRTDEPATMMRRFIDRKRG